MFLSEGIQKFLFPGALGVERFEGIGIPFPGFSAPFVGVLEIACGALIVVGLLTRLATIPLIVDMLVAFATTKVPEHEKNVPVSGGRIRFYALATVIPLVVAGLLWRQRCRPILHPPFLTFVVENPLTEAVAGSGLLLDRLDLAPGMRVLDAGCGPAAGPDL